eukprot:TRINITY_DN15430_c0_g1_i7.p1 TRINITY_DN15430_c0_g1~~TRINITY_DN15430_c0_g1_i7.p1  ORF type:complete len:218 (-),score=40.97 TRINITY_DN15430_c0_g1_i7:962-1615(-)
MKSNGKSDAQVRQIVAHHLPKGSGPEDLAGIKTFTQHEVAKCRRQYDARNLASKKNIQKSMESMRENRYDLREARQLFNRSVIVPATRREPGKVTFEGNGYDDDFPDIEQITEDINRSDCTSDMLRKVFLRFQQACPENRLRLNKARFEKLLVEICQSRTLVAADIQLSWSEILQRCRKGVEGADEKAPSSCTFEQFMKWYVSSEVWDTCDVRALPS